jgi:hypothetical protein
MNLDTLQRKILAACIRVGKEPTKRNILKAALKYYLTEGYLIVGLCYSINKTIAIKLGIPGYKASDVREKEFNLFNRSTAKKFGSLNRPYWWPMDDWKSRYKYMKWLIKQY